MAVQPLHALELESAIAQAQSGPHDGSGLTTAYPFFAGQPDLELIFRKRALHPGSSIGWHRNDTDEIYYVLSGQGELRVDEGSRTIGAGTAVLTRAGGSHALRQVGSEDLVILVLYHRGAASP